MSSTRCVSGSSWKGCLAIGAVAIGLSGAWAGAAPLLFENWETDQGNPPATWAYTPAAVADTAIYTTAHQGSTMLTMTDNSTTGLATIYKTIGSYTGDDITLTLDAYINTSSSDTSFPARGGAINFRNGNNIVAGFSFLTKGGIALWYRNNGATASYSPGINNGWSGSDVLNSITLTYNQVTGAVGFANAATGYSYVVTPAVATPLVVNRLAIATSTTAVDKMTEVLYLDNLNVAVPEPGAIGLLGVTAAGLLARRKRR